MLGTAPVLLPGGMVEDYRATAIEYTDWWVCTDSDFLVHRRTKIARVCALPGKGVPWVLGHRLKDDGIFKEDGVYELAGIGKEVPRS